MKKRHLLLGVGVAALLILTGSGAQALTLQTNTNLVGLLRDAEDIVIADVQSVTDGIDEQGLPYTEITLAIQESMRGGHTGTYAFRQIGLLAPRLTADGTKVMLPAPEGLPRYGVGERLMLFLGPVASMTGLRSPVGLGNGKFAIGGGAARNDYANAGIFQRIGLDEGLAAGNDDRLLATTSGSVNDADFVSFVRRAVSQNWVQTCRMWNTDEGKQNCGTGAQRPVRRARPGTGLRPSLTPQASGGSPTLDKN